MTRATACRTRRSGRFVTPEIGSNRDRDWVRSIYEDREGNLWVGMNSGLNRFRDDIITVYTKSDGLPSDEPTTVFQDSKGRIWVGFHDAGMGQFDPAGFKVFTTANGLASNEIFSIREARNGDLLISTREGLSRMHNGRFSTYQSHDPLGRVTVYDAMEDSSGRLWAAEPAGLTEIRGDSARNVIPGGRVFNNAVVVLSEGRGGVIWAGTYGKGLWRLEGDQTKLFTMSDGLSSDQIRSLVVDSDGTLWIGTFGGGLNALRNGRFHRYTAHDGLLSDN